MVRGMLDAKTITGLLEKGDIDTVLVVFPDQQGRFMGKRVTGDFFLHDVLDGEVQQPELEPGADAGEVVEPRAADLGSTLRVDSPQALAEGQVVVRRAYGMADLERRSAATPETDYRLASVSKQFTATAIMLLATDGKLRFDQSIGDFLPELPPGAPGAFTARTVPAPTPAILPLPSMLTPPGPLGSSQLTLSTRTSTYAA